MVSSGNTRHRDTKPCGRDFSAVQEVRSEETNWDEEVEQEYEESTGDLCRLVRFGEAGCDG